MPRARRPALLALLLAACAAVPAGAATPPSARVVLVTLDGSALPDWTKPGLPALRSILDHGAVGLLSTRTGDRGTSARGPFTRIPGARSLVLPRRADAHFPSGARTDFEGAAAALRSEIRRGSRFLIADAGDPRRADGAESGDPAARDLWMRLAMRRADRLIAVARASLLPTDLLIVASLAPPESRAREAVQLGAVAAAGAGIRPGLLESRSTRRAGLITLADLAATVAERLGSPVPGARAATLRSSRTALGEALALDRDLLLAAGSRRPATRGMLAAALALVALTLATVLGGRGQPASLGRIPRGWRDVLATLLLALSAMPLALLVAPALPVGTAGAEVIAATGMALAAAALARGALGRERGLAVILGATGATVLTDVLLGTPLGSRSPISFLPAAGARFWGIGNELMGALIAAAVLAAGLVMDRAREPRRLLPPVGVAFAVAVVVMAAPPLGAKLGAAPTAIPAFGAFLLASLGARLDRRAALGFGVAVVLAIGLAVAVDAARSPGAQSHIGRAVGGSEIGAILGRKIEAAARIAAFTVWSRVLLLLAAGFALLVRRHPALLGRALWGRVHLRAALSACLVGALAAVAFNDAGLVAATLIAMLAWGALGVVLLAGE
ncbi:MAG: hypothetical protein HY775_11415 [Acidobacteria bacterium]|nr:hypothetical protein [Acidobacteriota bacterium]